MGEHIPRQTLCQGMWVAGWDTYTRSVIVVEDELLRWVEEFGPAPLEEVLAVSSSVIVTTLPGTNQFVAYVRRINDEVADLLDQPRLVGVPVHLWFPETLDRIDEVTAAEIIITTAHKLDIAPLYRLGPAVKSLALNGTACARGALRLAALPHLSEIAVSWEHVDVGEGLPSQLRRLTVLEFSATRIDAIPASAQLSGLALYGARKMGDLGGVERFPALTSLEVYGGYNLTDVGAVVELPRLAMLEFEACKKLGRLDSIGRCRGLTRLRVGESGSIDSLAPLRDHAALEQLWAWGSTRIVDDDLSPLLTIPRLRELFLASRRSYRPSVGEVKEALGIAE